MSIGNILDIAGSGMSAQTLRLNTVASNMANAETISTRAEDAYRARYPVFKAVVDDVFKDSFAQLNKLDGRQPVAKGGVEVAEIIQSQDEAQRRYQPAHPLADEEGFVYLSGVNIVEQMADMISAQRSFEMNAEVANTAKSMMQRLITLGR